MDTKYDAQGGGSGLSTGHLLFVFLVGVAVCAVFFSLGFLVGYNERSLKEVLVGERVGPPPVVPPTVITPPETVLPAPGTPTGASTVPAPGTGPGSAPVTPEAAKPAAPAPAAAPPASAEATPPKPSAAGSTAPRSAAPGSELGVGITLQVAASRSREDADKMVDILKARGYPVFVVTPEYTNAQDNLYRVQVGPFRSTEEAETVRAKLVQEGLKPFIRR